MSNSTLFGSGSILISSILPCIPSSLRRGGYSRPSDPVLSKNQAWQALDNLRQQQASALAYFDCFWLMAVVMLALVFVVLFMKRSVAEKGAHHVVE